MDTNSSNCKDDKLYRLVESCLREEKSITAHFTYVQDNEQEHVEWPVLFVFKTNNPIGKLYCIEIKDQELSLCRYLQDPAAIDHIGIHIGTYDLTDPQCWKKIRDLVLEDRD